MMDSSEGLEIPRRLRRRRRTGNIRALLQESSVTVNDLIAPLFVHDRKGTEAIGSMPGIRRYGGRELFKEIESLVRLGLKAVALFPCMDSSLKNSEGTQALAPNGLILRTVRKLKQTFPEVIVIADVALDPYTDHGHDGVLNSRGEVDNDRTVRLLQKMAVLQAEAGCDWVAPSDMMDGRIAAIRQALDQGGFNQTSILAYAAKFASAFYGPFRDAVGSRRPKGESYLDKRTYQLNPANAREALQEALLDETEGADLLMVKPAGPYLDIIAALRQQTLLPIVGYQVSGEFSQIHAAAERGWLDLDSARDEAALAIKRAGADLVITYFAKDIARALADRRGR